MPTRQFVVVLAALVTVLIVRPAAADIPVHCLYEDYHGAWTYYLGPATFDNSVNCSSFASPSQKLHVDLETPNVAFDRETKRKGTWTRIYDEGVELVLDGWKYFAFSKYELLPNKTAVSICNTTFNGWFHREDGRNWGCFFAVKQPSKPADTMLANVLVTRPPLSANEPMRPERALVEAVNRDPSSTWRATLYRQFEGISMRDARAYGGNNPGPIPVHAVRSDPKLKAALPTSWDWTNVSGVNYVSPVRNQGACGSCYAFAATAMLETRTRVRTHNREQPVLSPQVVLSCSNYSQACLGGFAFLVAKFAQDFWMVPETCMPYAPNVATCSQRCDDRSQFSHAYEYQYVGGYFGACSEDAMMLELYDRGPMVVSFMVYSDFFSYHGGIYRHNSTRSAELSANPGWEETNHAVLLVGWGEEGGVPFWKVKNSWGETWGESGFFRIVRGVDECAIESMALAAVPSL